jgi:sugar fermentation stimulation protein A
MKFHSTLARGRLVSRYKRFFADVLLDDGREVTAHCPNPGAMLGMNAPGQVCWLSHDANPKRKLAYTWELVEADGALVICNTLTPNRLVAEALDAGAISELAAYPLRRREVAYGAGSRVDFLLEGAGAPAWVEVKGVTLRRQGGLAEWPDCVSARGARHATELGEMARLGGRAVVLFAVLRSDCDRFAVAADLDPAFAAALAAVRQHGVEVLAYACDVTADEAVISRAIPL